MSDQDDLEKVELEEVMRSTSGRAVILRILVRAGYFRDTFNLDSIIHAYDSGERAVAVWLFNEMKEVSPELLTKIITEHIENG